MDSQADSVRRWTRSLVFLVLGALLGPTGVTQAGDPAPDCREACKQQVLAEVEDCVRDNGEKDFCYREIEARVMACVRELCADPPPPPPPSCRELCKAHGQEALQQCLADGGKEAECLAAMESAVAECIRANCETEPPPEPGCEDRCHLAFEAMLEECNTVGADGGPNDPMGHECEQAAHEALRACMESCMEPPPPPPPGCRERCQLQIKAEVQKCLDAEADGAGDECWEGFERRVEECIAASCETLPPVPCEERCLALHDRMLEELLESGEAPSPRKLEEIELTFRRCLESCMEPPPPPPPGETCESRCRQLGQEIRSRCIGPDGVVDRECMAKAEAEAEAAVARCLKACGEPPPPPEPTCKERCALHAREVLAACRADGGSPERCEAQYQRALEECVLQNCRIEPPPPELSCHERCEQHARLIRDECAQNGGTEDDCKMRMAEAFRRCALGCSEPPPPEPPCEVACHEKVSRFLEECAQITDGVIEGDDGVARTCDEQAQRMLDRCLSSCGNDGEPPPEPRPCDDRCVAQAEEALQACIAAGGSRDTCRQRVDGVLSLCLERCGAPEPCEDRCALAAQIVMEGCALGGLPSEQCRRLANVVLEGCVSACNPPLGCEERCADIVQRAVRECRAQGGTEDECDALKAELGASCLARCGGEPMPPCEIQCEEKAEAFAEACAEKGLGEAECTAERARFLEECQKLHSESCVEEIQAELTMFRSFIRGDANRDHTVDVTDPIFVLNWLFTSGDTPTCEDAADANDDGSVDISDPITTLRHLFLGAETLPEPSSREGQDGTSDALLCAE